MKREIIAAMRAELQAVVDIDLKSVIKTAVAEAMADMPMAPPLEKPQKRPRRRHRKWPATLKRLQKSRESRCKGCGENRTKENRQLQGCRR